MRALAIRTGQLLLAIAIVLLARELTFNVWLVPSALRKQSPLDWSHLQTILTYFVVAHVVALGLSEAIHRQPFYQSGRRSLLEVYWAFCATSVASSSLFLLTVVPFSANFYAWIFVLVGIAYLCIFAGVHLAGLVREPTSPTAWLRLILGPWTLLAAVITLSPGVFAVLYKRSQTFSNLVNETKMRFNSTADAAFDLVQAFPGRKFDQPMWLTFEPGDDGHFYLLTRPGRLLRYSTQTPDEGEVMVDITQEVNGVDGEMGAFGFALHPQFNQGGQKYAYLWYTHNATDFNHNRLTRFDLSGATQAEREASRLPLMDLKRAPTQMHNGGTVMFGPDGFLYISIGDYQEQGNAQKLDKYLCCGVLRIDVDSRGGDISGPILRQPKDGLTQNYLVPLDNPWAGQPDVLGEIWAHGFRNPFRMSVDQVTGDVWLGDVGWDRWEEQNRVRKGDNGQWDYLEGPQETGRAKPQPVRGNELEPIHAYRQTALARATLGGVLYRGKRYASLTDQYVFGDNQAGTLMTFDPNDPQNVRNLAQASQFGQLGITSITVGPKGELLITALGAKDRPTGEILLLTEKGEGPAPAAPQQEVLSAAERVEQKYVSVCSRCHGVDGKGEPGLESSSGVTRPDFTTDAWQQRVTDDHILQVVTQGGEALGLSPEMPAWGPFFSEDEKPALVRKIRGFAGK